MLCAIAKIDPVSKERLSKVQQTAEKFGIPVRDLYGHITLVTYVGNAEEAFIVSCKDMLHGYKSFCVRYDKVEVLPATQIIVASPIKKNEIATIHSEIVKAWAEELDQWSRETIWHPHTTLVYHPKADLNVIANAMQEKFSPFDARIEKIEFSRVTEDGYKIVDSIALET